MRLVFGCVLLICFSCSTTQPFANTVDDFYVTIEIRDHDAAQTQVIRSVCNAMSVKEINVERIFFTGVLRIRFFTEGDMSQAYAIIGRALSGVTEIVSMQVGRGM